MLHEADLDSNTMSQIAAGPWIKLNFVKFISLSVPLLLYWPELGFWADTDTKLLGRASMSLSRRFFLGGLTLAPLARAGYDAATGTPEQRRNMALQIRENVATFENTLPIPAHPVNGDEQ